jgi:hypothetical protein
MRLVCKAIFTPGITTLAAVVRVNFLLPKKNLMFCTHGIKPVRNTLLPHLRGLHESGQGPRAQTHMRAIIMSIFHMLRKRLFQFSSTYL